MSIKLINFKRVSNLLNRFFSMQKKKKKQFKTQEKQMVEKGLYLSSLKIKNYHSMVNILSKEIIWN